MVGSRRASLSGPEAWRGLGGGGRQLLHARETLTDEASLLRFGSLFPEYLKRKHLSILSRVPDGHDFHIVRIEL